MSTRKFSLVDPDGAPVGTVEGSTFEDATEAAEAQGHAVRGHVGDSTLAVDTRGFCEWQVEVPDEYGTACSEPDVPTTIAFDCNRKATRKVWLAFEPQAGAPEGSNDRWLLCDEHASQLLQDVATGEALGTELVSDDPVSA